MEKQLPSARDQPLDFFATALTIFLCAIWGGAFVGIKISTLDMPPLGSGAVRFALTSIVLLLWARYHGVSLRCPRIAMTTLAVTVVLFVYINVTAYVGTSWSTAGRATVFFYTQPI